MIDSDIELLKERDDIRNLMNRGFSFPFSEFNIISENIETYRFGHDVEDDEFKNHETTYKQKFSNNSIDLPPNILYRCALSCYTSEEKAESALNTVLKSFKNIRLKIGNSLLYGTIEVGDGFVNIPDNNTHFDFYQNDCCDMHVKFVLFKILRPSGVSNDGTN